MLSLITDHGRAAPLVWLTADKRTLKDNRSLYEHQRAGAAGRTAAGRRQGVRCRRPRLRRPEAYQVLTEELCFDYVITCFPRQHRRHRHDGRNPHRCRPGCDPADAPACCAAPRSPPIAIRWANRRLRSGPRHEAGLVPRRQQHHSHSRASHWILCPPLGYRMCGLRDTNDLRFGMGLGAIHVKSPERRDRLWLINALLRWCCSTLLGASRQEALGYDRMLKTNTAKRRVPLVVPSGLYAVSTI